MCVYFYIRRLLQNTDDYCNIQSKPQIVQPLLSMRKLALALAIGAITLSSCDDSTSIIGQDVMPKGDDIRAIDTIFNVTSRTIKVDSVLANTSTCYLGNITDPVMKIQTTAGFMAQYHVQPDFKLPSTSKLAYGIKADSCDLRLYIDDFYGDSLATMKLRVRELSKNNVLDEEKNYYSNLNINDYINNNGIDKSIAYTVKDLTRPNSETDGKTYYRQIVVKLPEEYGTKLMQAYYENKENFSNSYKFIRNVCPGFSFECTGGMNSMVKMAMMSLNVYFSYNSKTAEQKDTIIGGMQVFGGTEEVLQTTHTNNRFSNSLSDEQIENNSCTYVKSPSSYFTEITLPVDEVVDGKYLNGEHYNDSINLAQLIIRRKQAAAVGSHNITYPSQLLLLRKSEVNKFFTDNKLPDSQTSYLSSITTNAKNYYSFTNIASLISYLKTERDSTLKVNVLTPIETRRQKYADYEAQHPDWNKIVLVPVEASYTTVTSSLGTTTSILRSVKNQLGISVVELEGGKNNPLRMQVIYNRYNQ